MNTPGKDGGRGRQACRGGLWRHLLFGFLGLFLFAGDALAEGDGTRGAYIFRAAGCHACHSDTTPGAPPLAGGRALKTPFGVFYSPNITPDRETGLGDWSLSDFAQALRMGVAPDGSAYFPAFPYPSYSGMKDEDIADLWAYLQSVEPVAKANLEHELDFPFGFRFLAGIWKGLFFEPGVFQEDPARDADWNRGAYLVRHLGHCGECHTPRGALGALDAERHLAGTLEGPEGKKVPNITPDAGDGIGEWSESDLVFFMEIGMLPDGDFAGGAMEEVISEGTSHLTAEDRKAIARYLLSVPALSGP